MSTTVAFRPITSSPRLGISMLVMAASAAPFLLGLEQEWWVVFFSKVLIPCMSQWYLSHACIMPLSAALPHSSTKANKEFLQQLHHQLSRIFRRLQGSRVRRLSGLGQSALCGLRPLHAAPMDCPRPAMQGESCKSWQIFEVLIISVS